MKRQLLGICSLAGASILFASASWADSGKVLSARDATVVRGGSEQALQLGGGIQVGDRISTGKSGHAKWVMDDDSMRAIARDSSLTVEKFAMPSTNGRGSTVMNLLKGALRTVSGLIGQSPSDEYMLRTPVATMGIRGTTYAAAWCQDNCFNAAPNGPRILPNGLYVTVQAGAVEITNPGGTLRVTVGQTGYVASANSPPRLVDLKVRVFDELADLMAMGTANILDFSLDVGETPPDPTPASPVNQ